MKNSAYILALICIKSLQCQLNFASIGNFGGQRQKEVAATLKTDSIKAPYSFLISPGSCFSDAISNLNDTKWNTEFHTVYNGLEFNLPFFVTLGSNDWEGNVTSMVLKTKDTYDQELSDRKGAKWTLPNFFYHYTQTFTDTSGATTFLTAPEISVFYLFIDTRILSQGFIDYEMSAAHWQYIKESLTAASRVHNWIIVVGDESIYSNGNKGGSKWLADKLRPILKENLVDAYISGRNNNLEIIEDGTLLHITCGSGSKGKHGRVRKHDGTIAFSTNVGYCRHKLDRNNLTTELIDGTTGEVIESFIKPRNKKNISKFDKINYINKIPTVKYRELLPGLGGMPGSDDFSKARNLFVTIFGTIGLFIYSLVLVAAIMTINLRTGQWMNSKTLGYVDANNSQALVEY